MQIKKSRVVVGMSGGVDSSVAAWLLREEGHDVIGVFMKNWEDDDHDSYCSSRQDFLDAVSVAAILGIDFEVVNFSREYKERVFSYFLTEYQAGRTPNPDVLCNTEIKFSAFLEYAWQLKADYIATGHYAQIRKHGNVFQLLKAEDGTKDQSYFLHRLNQSQLSKALFPLGTMTKRKIRQLAQAIGLPNHAKKDSTGICFIGERPFREFLAQYLPKMPGSIETLEGQSIGHHEGLSYYTIGQRYGLGIGGIAGTSNQPWFVCGKDMQRNVLQVVQGHDHPVLQTEIIRATNLHWIAGVAPQLHWVYTGKPRYRQVEMPCIVDHNQDNHITIRFASPQWAVTPGQYVVLYEGRVCLGGGVII